MLVCDAATSGEAKLVSHKHEQLLRTIFHDPISGNIHWREIESLLGHLSADIEQLSGARMRVKLTCAPDACVCCAEASSRRASSSRSPSPA